MLLCNFRPFGLRPSLRNRHESSNFHQRAVMRKQQDDTEPSWARCRGLDFASEDAAQTLAVQNINFLRQWMETGCIGVCDSYAISLRVFLRGDALILQDSVCSETPQVMTRNNQSCPRCQAAANRVKAINQIKEWCQRVTVVDICHAALVGDAKLQHKLADELVANFPEMSAEKLHEASYSSLIFKCRNTFMKIGIGRQNTALKAFLDRNVRYLTPQIVAGVSQEMRKDLLVYVERLGSGSISKEESHAIARHQVVRNTLEDRSLINPHIETFRNTNHLHQDHGSFCKKSHTSPKIKIKVQAVPFFWCSFPTMHFFL